MTGDREMDIEIALLLGWQGPAQWIEDAEGRDPYAYPPHAPASEIAADVCDDTGRGRRHDVEIPRYSTDWTATGELLDWLAEHGYRPWLRHSATRRLWEARIADTNREWRAADPSGLRALCKVVVRMIGGDDGHG